MSNPRKKTSSDLYGFRSTQDAEEFIRRLAAKGISTTLRTRAKTPIGIRPGAFVEAKTSRRLVGDEFWEAVDLKDRYVVRWSEPSPQRGSNSADGGVVSLTHTTEEGTIARGDTRPFKDVLAKTMGFRWYGKGGFWYYPRTRGITAPPMPLETWAVQLRNAGATVETGGVLAATPEAPAMKVIDPLVEKEERAARLREAAERAAAEAQAQFQRSHDAVAGIPMGQPILVGHHSERKHRRDLEKSHKAMEKGIEAAERAKDLARKADRLERQIEKSESGAMVETVTAFQQADALAAYVSKNLKRDVGAETVRKETSTYAIGFYVRYPDSMGIRPWSVRVLMSEGHVGVEVGQYMEPSRRVDVTNQDVESVYEAIASAMPKSPSAKFGTAAPVKPARATRAEANEAAIEFDRQLAVGQRVEARWTNSGYAYKTPATIVSLADKSLRVSLDQGIEGSYPAGRVILLPRFFGTGYSAKNGAHPLGGS